MSDFEVLETAHGVPIKSWTKGVPVEIHARQQLINLASLPFVFHHVAAMPDIHWGMGATVGSVIATRGAIIPAAVGVDIGCGMQAQQLEISAYDLPDSLVALRSVIEHAVPHGRTDNGGPNDRGAWNPDTLPSEITSQLEIPNSLFTYRLDSILAKHPRLNGRRPALERSLCHLGTLGTGNHFIELCLDESDRVWVMLHSGSRGVGNTIGTYFIERAKRQMEKYFISLPDADLAYIPEDTEDFDDYLEAVSWAQDYARLNRRTMMRATIKAIEQYLGWTVVSDWSLLAVNCHHNYVERENHFGSNVLLARKGAVRAREGDLGIIPGSMGAKSFIVRGKGNPESFMSCAHGAGRRMSRNEAKKTFTLSDHEIATQGVECRKDKDVLDETPGAYKDIDSVMAAQSSLVEIVHTLKGVLCVKG